MDDVVLQKAASIERCVKRVKEEYAAAGDDLYDDFTHQDAIILNLQRACEQSIDLANHIIRKSQWTLPGSSRESFDVLAANGAISSRLAHRLKKMVGFRNLAVHEYERLNIDILKKIVEQHLDEFTEFSSMVLKKFG
jgi:uncharacterized protein YutE (UPF0331/DUF86 family)